MVDEGDVVIPPSAAEAFAPMIAAGLAKARFDGYHVPGFLWQLSGALTAAAQASRSSRTGVVNNHAEGLSNARIEGMSNEIRIKDAANAAGVSRQALDRRCRRGTLPFRTDERGWRWVRPEDLERPA